MFMRLFLLTIYVLARIDASAQGLHTQWTRFVGPDSCCAGINYSIKTADNGVIFTGGSGGYNVVAGSGDVNGGGYGGTMVGKLDSNRNIAWMRTYGGNGGFVVCPTRAGGYAILARVLGPTGLAPTNYGAGDLWLFEIDSVGNYLWGKDFGSTGEDYPMSLIKTTDNGYLMLGASNGSDHDIPRHMGTSMFNLDWFLIKTDSLGNKQWGKVYGGTDDDGFTGCLTNANGYYYIFSSSSSKDYDCIDSAWHSGHNSGNDWWLLKIDDTGAVVWSKSYGGTGGEVAGECGSAVWDNRDSSFVLVGQSTSNDFMVTGNHGWSDILVMKIRKDGSFEWSKLIGTPTFDRGSSVAITATGYVVCGWKNDITDSEDVKVAELDMLGNVLSDTSVGGPLRETAASVFPYRSGYIVTGNSNSPMGFREGFNLGHMPEGEPSQVFISYLNILPNGVKELSKIPFSVAISPNPTVEMLELKSSSEEISKIVITDVFGRVLLSRSRSGREVHMSVKSFSPGVYVLQCVSNSGSVFRSQFIKL